MAARRTSDEEPSRGPRGQQPALVAKNGPAAGRVYQLVKGESVLGRHAECDILVDVGAVSRYHCRVVNDGTEARVEDLGSRSGTYVNGVLIAEPTVLKQGDEIRICDVVFAFEAAEANLADVLSSAEPPGRTRGSDAVSMVAAGLPVAVSEDKVLPHLMDSLFRIFPQADRGVIGLVDASGELKPRWTKLRRDDDETISVSSTISVPLVDEAGEAMGLVQLETLDQDRQFDEDDSELLAGVAGLASVAIQIAQVHKEQLQQQALVQDLRLAAELLHAFLPDAQPEVEGYEFFELFRAANQICGDFHDYVFLPDGRLVMIVGDVVGYGIAAAMLAAKTSGEARFCLASEPRLATAVTMLNQRLCRLGVNRFVTSLVVALDARTHEVTIVNAGHPPLIRRHADGSLDEPSKEAASMPLGILGGVAYEEVSLRLQPGESLILFTDGVVTATNASETPFIDQLGRLIGTSEMSPRVVGEAIVAGLRRNVGDMPQEDDICLIVFGGAAAGDQAGEAT